MLHVETCKFNELSYEDQLRAAHILLISHNVRATLYSEGITLSRVQRIESAFSAILRSNTPPVMSDLSLAESKHIQLIYRLVHRPIDYFRPNKDLSGFGLREYQNLSHHYLALKVDHLKHALAEKRNLKDTLKKQDENLDHEVADIVSARVSQDGDMTLSEMGSRFDLLVHQLGFKLEELLELDDELVDLLLKKPDQTSELMRLGGVTGKEMTYVLDVHGRVLQDYLLHLEERKAFSEISVERFLAFHDLDIMYEPFKGHFFAAQFLFDQTTVSWSQLAEDSEKAAIFLSNPFAVLALEGKRVSTVELLRQPAEIITFLTTYFRPICEHILPKFSIDRVVQDLMSVLTAGELDEMQVEFILEHYPESIHWINEGVLDFEALNNLSPDLKDLLLLHMGIIVKYKINFGIDLHDFTSMSIEKLDSLLTRPNTLFHWQRDGWLDADMLLKMDEEFLEDLFGHYGSLPDVIESTLTFQDIMEMPREKRLVLFQYSYNIFFRDNPPKREQILAMDSEVLRRHYGITRSAKIP